jgi:CheY-like chemotaxis protein
VLRAASAEQALLMAPEQQLHLITLDIRLPGMDGWQFLQRLREMPALARVPVVVISGLANADLALTGGAAAILQKPISRVQLQSSLHGLGLHPALERTHTVLVVDHDLRAVESIAGFLPMPAYAVVRAYTGSEAIFLTQHMRPDLILLDLMLPDLSGFEVAEALQRNAATARIPILIGAAAQTERVQSPEKSGLDQARFIAEVRRAMLPH